MNKKALLLGIFVFVVALMGTGVIAYAQTINTDDYEYNGTYTDSGYDRTDVFLYEGINEIRTTRYYRRLYRQVKTTLNVIPVSNILMQVWCRIGKNSTDYDYDYNSINSAYTYDVTAEESWSLFKNTGYTYHKSQTNQGPGNDVGSRGVWIYD